jgi:STE24 endopeptidase
VGAVGQADARSEAEQDETAARLGRTRRRLFFLNSALSLALPALLWSSGLAALLWERTAALGSPWLRLPAYAGLLLLLLAIFNLPGGWYGGFRLRHRYGLSRQSLSAWMAEWAKAALLGLGFGVLATCAFYGSQLLLGPDWWWAFAVLLSLAVLIIAFLAPYVLVPLFFRLRPLEQPEAVETVRELAARAGATVRQVCTLDFSRKTVEANAAVIGFGRSRRVVLADTLLATFSLPELGAVVAHELGHHVHRDVPRLLAVQLILVWSGLALLAAAGEPLLALAGASGGLAWPPNLPLLLAGAELLGLATLPWTNLLSRRREAAADRFAVGLTGDPSAFSSAMLKLARQNLAEIWPPRWAELMLQTHPAIGRRILAAEAQAGAA